jgi:hypothetical protein
MKQLMSGLLLLTYFSTVNAQDMTGEYYMHGVMETASGFLLNADSTFQFFFSYGALDRSGKGKWSLKDDSTIIFNSEKRPPLDFKLVKHELREDNFITIQITDKNTNLLRYVAGFVKTRTGEEEFEMNHDGIAQMQIQQIDSIGLIFTICPDRYSVFPVSDKNENYFSFQFEPWIADVFFENFTLNFKNNTLSGKHPLLEGDDFSYEKD